MKNRMKLAWQKEREREVFLWDEGRAWWLSANRLQCNLHSCGWISNVGVLYKGIWPPACRLGDIQLAPLRVTAQTQTESHLCTDMRGEQDCRVPGIKPWIITVPILPRKYSWFSHREGPSKLSSTQFLSLSRTQIFVSNTFSGQS